MKIVKHGNKYTKEKSANTESFECKNCGCEFNAKIDEYHRDYGGPSKIFNPDSITYTYSTYTIPTVIQDYLVCSCPECHKIIKKIVERKIDYFTCPNDITYTNKTNADYKTTCNGTTEETNGSVTGL